MVILSHMRSLTSRPDSGEAMALATDAMSECSDKLKSSKPGERHTRAFKESWRGRSVEKKRECNNEEIKRQKSSWHHLSHHIRTSTKAERQMWENSLANVINRERRKEAFITLRYWDYQHGAHCGRHVCLLRPRLSCFYNFTLLKQDTSFTAFTPLDQTFSLVKVCANRPPPLYICK